MIEKRRKPKKKIENKMQDFAYSRICTDKDRGVKKGVSFVPVALSREPRLGWTDGGEADGRA
jgi:hypothetical protein